jgi:DNA-binding MarR family transcriptional regulator
MAGSTDFQKISEAWIRILNRMNVDEKNPKDFGSGDLLHCSEIHSIMAIGRHPDINITNLSRLLGISKSAISQMMTKLERKRLVEKNRDPKNEKEILCRLSPRGTIAYLGHEQHHARIQATLHEKLDDLSNEDFDLILRFCIAVEETYKESDVGPY